VTNPPLDAIREELVTSLGSAIGPEGNLLDAEPGARRQIVLPFPVIDNDELAKIVHINDDGDLPGFAPSSSGALRRHRGAGRRCAPGSTRSAPRSPRRSRAGRPVHRPLGPRLRPRLRADPVAAAHRAVHHHLIREKTRTQVGPARRGRRRPRGPPRRPAHRLRRRRGQPLPRHGVRRGHGASGVITGVDEEKAVRNLIKALGKGVLKVMSKMGISTVASYRGAQVFEAIGLSQELVDEYFTGTVSQLGGIGLDVIAEEAAARHADGIPAGRHPPAAPQARVGGEYQWRREGEPHLFDPETVFRCSTPPAPGATTSSSSTPSGSTTSPSG
jgi:glutamate synthase (NADPH/NADH) large chain